MTLQNRVTEWHLSVWPVCDAQSIADKALEECIELTQARGDEEVSDELADVYLCLLALAGRAGFDLQELAERKFAINQQRAKDGRWE